MARKETEEYQLFQHTVRILEIKDKMRLMDVLLVEEQKPNGKRKWNKRRINILPTKQTKEFARKLGATAIRPFKQWQLVLDSDGRLKSATHFDLLKVTPLKLEDLQAVAKRFNLKVAKPKGKIKNGANDKSSQRSASAGRDNEKSPKPKTKRKRVRKI